MRLRHNRAMQWCATGHSDIGVGAGCKQRINNIHRINRTCSHEWRVVIRRAIHVGASGEQLRDHSNTGGLCRCNQWCDALIFGTMQINTSARLQQNAHSVATSKSRRNQQHRMTIEINRINIDTATNQKLQCHAIASTQQ